MNTLEPVLTAAENRIGRFFRISVFLKGIHALLEILGGVLLLIVTPGQIVTFIVALTQDELIQDPNDYESII